MKKSNSLFKRTVTSLTVVALIFLCQPVQAQSADALISAINAVRASLDGIVHTAATYIFQTPPNIGNELVTNKTQVTAAETVSPNVQDLLGQDISKGLQPDPQNPNAALVQMASIQAGDTVLSSTFTKSVPMPFYSSTAQSGIQNALAQGNQNLSFQSLMSPLFYKDETAQNLALNYIRFVSGYAMPFSNLSLARYPESQLSVKQKLTIQNTASYQEYQVQRRQLIAQQSAALSNLYYLYSKRLPIETIHAGDTALGVETPSAAQIEHHIATWRTASPTWYTQMATVSQTNVARETLFVLAEIQTELHQIHLDNQRLIALMAIGQLTSLQTNKQILGVTERQVQDQISQVIQGNAASGTTSGSTNMTPPPGQVQRLQNQQQQVKSMEKTQQANQPATP
jgi:hypothetical protein